jgi:hypothetical protein
MGAVQSADSRRKFFVIVNLSKCCELSTIHYEHFYEVKLTGG